MEFWTLLDTPDCPHKWFNTYWYEFLIPLKMLRSIWEFLVFQNTWIYVFLLPFLPLSPTSFFYFFFLSSFLPFLFSFFLPFSLSLPPSLQLFLFFSPLSLSSLPPSFFCPSLSLYLSVLIFPNTFIFHGSIWLWSYLRQTFTFQEQPYWSFLYVFSPWQCWYYGTHTSSLPLSDTMKVIELLSSPLSAFHLQWQMWY